jgi:hypothetical protein
MTFWEQVRRGATLYRLEWRENPVGVVLDIVMWGGILVVLETLVLAIYCAVR